MSAATANFFTFGAMYSFGVFLTPLVNEFNSSTGPVSTLFSVTVCFYYIGGAIGGRLSDRHGSRPIIATSAVLLTGGLLLTATTTQLWQAFFSFGLLVGLSVGFCYTSSIGLVSRTFSRNRAFALGVLLAGVGTGVLVTPIISEAIINAYSWQAAYACLAVLALPTTVWATFNSDRIRAGRRHSNKTASNRASSNSASATDNSADNPTGKSRLLPLSALTRNRQFRRYYLAVILLGPGFYVPILFYNDYAVDQGIGSSPAALLVGISGASSVFGRLAYGLLDSRMGAMNLCRLSYALLLAALVVWLGAGSVYTLLVVSAVTHGLGWAILATSTPSVLTNWLGANNLGGTIGVYYTGLGVGALAGPAAGGFIIDRAGFAPAIALSIATTLGALLMLFAIKDTASNATASHDTASNATSGQGPPSVRQAPT